MAAAAIGGAAWADDGPSAAVLAATAPAVLRVTAGECSGAAPDRAASGFAYRAAGLVVTVLHVVQGCRTISVGYQGITELPAHVIHVLQDADLALLEVEGATDVTPLVETDRAGDVNEVVDVYGFALGQATRENRRLIVTAANEGGARLRDAVNDDVRRELQQNGFPSLDTLILRVDGNLLPGHSGAPIIDSSGRVIAIGSGGLERGAVGVGWAVRATYLAQLLDAPATAAIESPTTTESSFAYVEPAEVSGARPVTCGSLDFTLTRQRTLEQLVASSDDPRGFQWIAASSGQPLENFADLTFDIWTEESGVGVAVPAGATLQPAGNNCMVDLINGQFVMWVGGAALPPLPLDYTDETSAVAWLLATQSASQQFEYDVAGEFLPYLQLNPNFSYVTPVALPNMLVNRELFEGQDPGRQMPHAVFETSLATPRSFVGVAAISRKYVPPYMLTEEEFRTWVAAVFSTFLSTVPIGLQ
ncbi:MAG TPA: serine protease [Dongiaceae bacterium]|jgi:S1-C subfamily serine protease|nr:serine protease [Dongiaceae bacterium]